MPAPEPTYHETIGRARQGLKVARRMVATTRDGRPLSQALIDARMDAVDAILGDVAAAVEAIDAHRQEWLR